MWCPSSGHSWRGYSAFAGARLPICSADHPMRGRTGSVDRSSLGSDVFGHCTPFVLAGAEIAQRRVPAASIEEALDVLE